MGLLLDGLCFSLVEQRLSLVRFLFYFKKRNKRLDELLTCIVAGHGPSRLNLIYEYSSFLNFVLAVKLALNVNT